MNSDSPVCVLVGVGPGLGFSLARKFGQEGCKIALVARDGEKLSKNVKSLGDYGVMAHVFLADVTDHATLNRQFIDINETLGPPTILIFNVATVTLLPPSELPVDVFLRDLLVNTVGALCSVQHVLPTMKAAGCGTILFSSAGVGIEPQPTWASYAATKAALRNLAFSISTELSNSNIHVSTVTIAGRIEAGTNLDPDLIAAEYWRLHIQKKENWERELVLN